MVASRASILGCAAVLLLGQRLGRASGESEDSCLWIQQGIDCYEQGVRMEANSWGIMAMHLANRGLSSGEVRIGFSIIYGDVRVHVSSTLYRFSWGIFDITERLLQGIVSS